MHRQKAYTVRAAAAAIVVAAGILLGLEQGWAPISSGEREAAVQPASGAQLVSIQPLPETGSAECPLVPASAQGTLLASFQQSGGAHSTEPATPAEAAKRKPVREIHDPYSSFSSVAVDNKHDEIVMTDENLFKIMIYDRRTNTPPRAAMSEPKRVIAGSQTKIEFQCGVYIDPENGDLYAVNNDTVDTLVIFSRNAKGNVPPDRELHTPHGTFGIAVDEGRKEMFLTIQHSNAITVFDKYAKGNDKPLRTLQGNATKLADPHGIVLDSKSKLMFVTNHGSLREFQPASGNATNTMPSRRAISGSGRMVPSSINVYAIDAKGDEAPLRAISGPKTRLDWPTGLAFDEAKNEIYVANDMGDEVLVFDGNAEGDAAPKRVLKGPKTGIKNPTGVHIDKENQELLVSNFGNHSATVYKLTADGDVPPLRKIRSGPVEEPALMIGNPGSVAYDSKRENILVPN